MSFTDLSLPIVMGIITPGNKTVFLNGNIGMVSGASSLEILASSSSLINGKNSVSSFNKSDKFSDLIPICFFIKLLLYNVVTISVPRA